MLLRDILVGSCVFLLACGGAASDEPTTEEVEVAATTSGAEEVQLAWVDMNHEQKASYMADVVMPRMQPLFQAYDAEAYADFSCATCHGDDAQEVGFRMPNGLHPLSPEHIPSMFESADPDVQRVAQFMAGEVTPAMTELLGAQPFDPETHEGFSCMSCHATAE